MPDRPDDRVELRVAPDRGGSSLEWLLLVPPPADPVLLPPSFRRLQQLLNGDLRDSFD